MKFNKFNILNIFQSDSVSPLNEDPICEENTTLIIRKKDNVNLVYLFQGNITSAMEKVESLWNLLTTHSIFQTMQNLDRSEELNLQIAQMFQNKQNRRSSRTRISTTEILNGFSIILHPIRFAMLQLLYYESKISRAELMRRLDISSASMKRHVQKLQDADYITSEYEFHDGRPRRVLCISNKGFSSITNFQQRLSETIVS